MLVTHVSRSKLREIVARFLKGSGYGGGEGIYVVSGIRHPCYDTNALFLSDHAYINYKSEFRPIAIYNIPAVHNIGCNQMYMRPVLEIFPDVITPIEYKPPEVVEVVVKIYNEILRQLSEVGYLPSSGAFVLNDEVFIKIGRHVSRVWLSRTTRIFDGKHLEVRGYVKRFVFANECPIYDHIVETYREVSDMFERFTKYFDKVPPSVYERYRYIYRQLRHEIRCMGRNIVVDDPVRGVYVGHKTPRTVLSSLERLKEKVSRLIDDVAKEVVIVKLGLEGMRV
jgi:hypothetical protein